MLLSQDRELREAFRLGKPAALERVYLAYAPEVGAYLSNMFPARARSKEAGLAPLDLDSVLQEVFLRAFKADNRLAYDGIRPYRGMLFSMAKMTAIDWIRAQGKLASQSIPLDAAPEVGALRVEERSPEERALESELRGVVAEFLGKCEEGDRRLVELRFVEGLSQEVAAEKLGLSRGEVRWREKRIKKAFTEHVIQRGWMDAKAAGGGGSGVGLSPTAPRALLLLLAWLG
ncbi:MAG: sigma-70 family RNA polymerase sigma factor [Deltaproteobacteria bacterium]|nr:sigma-70 family RNA polymerase sigma factor [Deltaproteobacteria bacterium]